MNKPEKLEKLATGITTPFLILLLAATAAAAFACGYCTAIRDAHIFISEALK